MGANRLIRPGAPRRAMQRIHPPQRQRRCCGGRVGQASQRRRGADSPRFRPGSFAPWRRCAPLPMLHIAMRRALSTYFHRRVIHMIVFSRPPGRRRRAGDVSTSSSGARARRWPRKATLRAAVQALTLPSRGPCDAPASRRTTLLAEEPARPSDVSPSYESKYWTRAQNHPGQRVPIYQGPL